MKTGESITKYTTRKKHNPTTQHTKPSKGYKKLPPEDFFMLLSSITLKTDNIKTRQKRE